MARQLDFYFDCSSPWTYLAFHAVQPLAAELGAEIAWKPILVGGVFNAVNQTVYDNRTKPNPLKQSYMLKDLADWARLYGLRIAFPPKVFPVNSVKCMRGAFHALDEGKLVPYRSRRPALLRRHRDRRLQAEAARQHRRAHGPRRLRESHHVRRRLDVLRQRPPAAREGGVGGSLNRITSPVIRGRPGGGRPQRERQPVSDHDHDLLPSHTALVAFPLPASPV
jgi:hypothetical protein